MDDRIKLDCPFPIYAVPRVFSWMQQSWDKVADDFTPRDTHGFVEDWRRKDRAGRRTWAVLNDGELVGAVMSTALSPIVADMHFIFRRDFWGRGNTVPALALACAAIFDSGVEKISSLTYPDNRALAGIAMANGATNEGTLRRHTRKNGKRVDLLLLGFTKEDFNERRSRWGLQQPGQQQPIQQLDDEQRLRHDDEKPLAGAGRDPAVAVSDDQQVHDESASRREPVAAGGR